MKSSGFKKDLLVAIFCSALLKVSEEDMQDDDVVFVDPCAEVAKELNSLAMDIQALLNRQDEDVKKWVRSKTISSAREVIKNINAKSISLETLAMYILFINFIERAYPLDDDLKFLVSKYDYMELAEQLNQTELGQAEAEMFKLSYEILLRLR